MNARHDPVTSQTLPNHIDMFSGRLVKDHGYEKDADLGGELPPMDNIFSLVAQQGRRSAFYGSKEKFDLLRRSWPMNRYLFEKRASRLIPQALKEISENHYTFTFLHIRSPDRAGHKMKGSANRVYRDSVVEADGYLGKVRALIESDPQLKENTAIVLTSDHAFSDYGNHADEAHRQNFQIPFCTWGPGVKAGADLYALNEPRGVVANPYSSRGHTMKVIRNAYAGVLSADWLGIQPMSKSGSAMADQYLVVADEVATPALPATPTATPTAMPSSAPTFIEDSDSWLNRFDKISDLYMLDGASFSENYPDRTYDAAKYGYLLINNDPRLDAVLRFELPPDIEDDGILEATLEVQTVYGKDPIGFWIYQGSSNNWSPSTVNWSNVPGFDSAAHVGTFEATEERGISKAVLNGVVATDGYVNLMIVAARNENYSALRSSAKLIVKHK